jgi:hypothetical protein
VPPTLPIATQPALDRLGAYAAARGMSALLFGVAPSDPATFATAVGVTLLMTVSGSRDQGGAGESDVGVESRVGARLLNTTA